MRIGFHPKRCKGAGESLKNNKRENYDHCNGMRRGMRVRGVTSPTPLPLVPLFFTARRRSFIYT